jgi:hypothetical protein
MTINFSTEAIIDTLIEAVEARLSADQLLALIETVAASRAIDLGAAPALNGVVLKGATYRAYTNWVQALHAGFQYHRQAMISNGMADSPFIMYAEGGAVFRITAFALNSTPNDKARLFENDAYDLVCERGMRQVDWVNWLRGPDAILYGAEAWFQVVRNGKCRYALIQLN